MRDAFGGVFMMRLMLVFIVVFVGFGAVSLNYAKAFRVKNSVIDLIEQNQLANINDIYSRTDLQYDKKLDAIIDRADYNVQCNVNDMKDNATGKIIGICYGGIVIKVNNERNDDNNIYYDVFTYGGWNLKFLNMK